MPNAQVLLRANHEKVAASDAGRQLRQTARQQQRQVRPQARRTIHHQRAVEWLALAIASTLFGIAHIFYGGVESTAYAIGMALKSSAAGLVFGLVFWRWGLPHSMLAHCTANGVHLLLMPLLFARAG